MRAPPRVAAKAERSEVSRSRSRDAVVRTGRSVRRSSRIGQYEGEIPRAGLATPPQYRMALFRFTPRRCLELQVSLFLIRFSFLNAREGFRATWRRPIYLSNSLVIYFSTPFLLRNSKSPPLLRWGISKDEKVAACDLYGADSLSFGCAKKTAGFVVNGWMAGCGLLSTDATKNPPVLVRSRERMSLHEFLIDRRSNGHD